MSELRAFMMFLTACDAGTAPSPRQRAGCVLRLDALSAVLHEPSYHETNRYEVEVELAGGSENVMLRPREIEVLGWRQKGLSPKEIAHEMGITLLTVRSYIRDAASKLDVSGWEAAVRKAIELGIL
jgi:DNA-binding CsgD family transcriptional regulator